VRASFGARLLDIFRGWRIPSKTFRLRHWGRPRGSHIRAPLSFMGVTQPQMQFEESVTYDVFITHAWRYHDDWNRAADVLDGVAGFKWRNFSVPWYDPAMDPNTAVGGRFVRDWLEGQIQPSNVVLFLDSVYSVK